VADALVAEGSHSKVPNFEENRFWYHQETLSELCSLWTAIRDMESPFAIAAEASFSAILRFVSSQRGPVNRIADNVRPATLKYHPAIGLFFSRLQDYFPLALRQEMESEHSNSYQAWSESAPTALAALPDALVDLVVTQLPAPGAVDYVRSHRLTALWFGWPIDEHASAEIGARYKRRRANLITEYREAIDKMFAQMARVVKAGGWCALILGSAIYRNQMTGELSRILSHRDFELVALLGGRSRSGGRTIQSETVRHDIIVARRKG
jgi:hypothetical protein